MRFLFDLAYTVRLLKKSSGFTLLSTLVLAGGLAVSLFTFAFLYTFTSKPLPLPEQGTLYRASLFWHGEAFGDRRFLPAYEAAKVRQKSTFFEEHGVWQNKTVYLSLGDNNLVTSAVRASSNIFQVSRTQPLLGRPLQPNDSNEGEQPVVVISYSIWQSQFAGDVSVIGENIYINDVLTEIVGVMPKGYRFPISHDLWLPISNSILDPLVTDREKVELFARLKKGVNAEQVKAQVYEIAKESFDARSAYWPGIELIRSELGLFQQFDLSAEMKLFCFALNTIAFLILLLAAINVGNLLFARAIQRNKESAVRIALGATQWRLVTQLMLEGCIITLVGTLLAVGLVGWLLNLINIYFHSLMNNELAFWYIWELDANIVGTAAGFALATILVACFLPAIKAARQDFNVVLRAGTRGAQGRKEGRLSRFLVTMQITSIFIIMVLGSVISLKIHHLTDMKLGYDVSGVFFSIIELPERSYPKQEDKSLFFNKLQRNLASNSAFSGVSARFDYRKRPVGLSNVEYDTDASRPKIQIYSVIGRTDFMGPTLVSGRHLDQRDNGDSALTAMISDSMAKRYWSGDSPIDRRIEVDLEGVKHWATIVGVVSDTSNNPFRALDERDEVYLSGYQFSAQRATVFFEKAPTLALIEDEFFNTINNIDNKLDILTIEDWELETSSISKMTITFRDTIIICGVLSMILAMSGIYGLTAFSVEKRSQEVGIRRALGAKDSKILVMFVKQGARQLLFGSGMGIAISGLILLVISRIINLPPLTYGAIYGLVALSLSTIVIAAIVVPARRAVSQQPSTILRYE